MPIRIPAFNGLPVPIRLELQQALRDLDAQYRKGALGSLDGRQTLSAQHARIVELQHAINPRDAVPLAQVTLMMDKLRAELKAELGFGTKKSGVVASGGGGGGGGGGNALPPATHRINVSYYFTEYFGDYGGDGWGDVYATTNAYYVTCKSQYAAGGDPPSVWIPRMAGYVARAYNQGKRIHYLFEYDHDDVRPYIDDVLQAIAPYWDRINSLEIADEPNPSVYYDPSLMNALAIHFKSDLAANGLTQSGKSFSISLSPEEATSSNLVNCVQLDRIGANLYVDPPGGTIEQNTAYLNSYIPQFKAHVPQDKNLHFTCQAYDRNGYWTDIATLAALQPIYYLHAYNDARVRALWWFSYFRYGGTAFHPELRAHHINIFNAVHPQD